MCTGDGTTSIPLFGYEITITVAPSPFTIGGSSPAPPPPITIDLSKQPPGVPPVTKIPLSYILGQTYFARIRGINSAGVGSYSNWSNGATAMRLPGAPRNFSGVNNGQLLVKLGWNLPAEMGLGVNVSNPWSYFQVFRNVCTYIHSYIHTWWVPAHGYKMYK